MNGHIKESDWKVFRSIHEIALNRFCERILTEVQQTAAADGSKSPHEKYLQVFKLIEERDDEMARAFSDFRRSTASLQLGIIYSLGVLTEEELMRFSPETQALVKALFEIRNGR